MTKAQNLHKESPADSLRLFFHENPDLPQIDDYYEPWTYDYERLYPLGLLPFQPPGAHHQRSSDLRLPGLSPVSPTL